jgi:hypothetical protein
MSAAFYAENPVYNKNRAHVSRDTRKTFSKTQIKIGDCETEQKNIFLVN